MKKILKSFDFTSLSEKLSDDLQMKEIEIWEYVLNGVLHKIRLSFQILKLGQMMISKQ
jgi:hypothetical protein